MIGILEGLESQNDSPGLGLNAVEFQDLPVKGKPFRCVFNGDQTFRTSRVESVQHDGDTVRFRTLNTTYILKVRQP